MQDTSTSTDTSGLLPIPVAHDRSLHGVMHRIYEWPGHDDRATLILLHGWMDTGAGFAALAAALDGWRCIAPDWRGFGDSARSTQGRYWFPDYLADLDALLEQYVTAEERVVLIGHSMGGNVAGLYAGVRPECVNGLVSLEGFGLEQTVPEDAPKRYRHWLDSLNETPQLRQFDSFDALAGHLKSRNPQLSNTMAAHLAHCWGYQDAGRVTLRGDPAHRRPNPVLYRLDEAMACWRAVQAPTLWVWGERSAIASRLRQNVEWTERTRCFRHFHIAAVPEAGHALHQEQPEAVAQIITRFLADHVG